MLGPGAAQLRGCPGLLLPGGRVRTSSTTTKRLLLGNTAVPNALPPAPVYDRPPPGIPRTATIASANAGSLRVSFAVVARVRRRRTDGREGSWPTISRDVIKG